MIILRTTEWSGGRWVGVIPPLDSSRAWRGAGFLAKAAACSIPTTSTYYIIQHRVPPLSRHRGAESVGIVDVTAVVGLLRRENPV